MRGRMPTRRLTPPGPHPDWSAVAWYIYADPVELPGGVTYHCYRVSPRALSQGERRRFEKLVAVVRRCSLKTVRWYLKGGIVRPDQIQACVDIGAERQARRSRSDFDRGSWSGGLAAIGGALLSIGICEAHQQNRAGERKRVR